MLKIILNSTWRNLRKRKLQSFIQIFSLSLAFAIGIILFLSARYELSFDDFHANKEQIGLLYFESNSKKAKQTSDVMPMPLGPTMRAELPYVDKLSRFGSGGMMIKAQGKEISIGSRFVDADFLSMFSFELKHGNVHALDELNSLIITHSTAKSLFGRADIIGEQVEVNAGAGWKNMLVSAVAADLPQNSSLSFQSLLRFENMPDYDLHENWQHKNHSVFIQSKDVNLNREAFAKAAVAFTEQHFKKDIEQLEKSGATPNRDGSYLALSVLPFGDYHLNNLQLGTGSSPLLPKVLLGLAALIMLISISNFINIGMATALTRSQEIAVKKSLGGSRKQISLQLWTESFFYCILAFAIGIFMAWLSIPQYKAITGFPIQFQQLLAWQTILMCIAMFFLVALMAGGYPTLHITQMNIISLLKNKLSLNSNWSLQQLLPILQFTIAIVLVVVTTAIVLQMQYMNKMPLGFNKEQVISIPVGRKVDGERSLSRMRQALASNSNVLAVTGSDINLGMGRDGSQSSSELGFVYEDKEIFTHWQRVDHEYLRALDIPLVAGRAFSAERSTDSTAIILNEKMAAQIGDPQAIIGKTLRLFDKDMEIVGVAKDYNFKDLRQAIEPLTLFMDPTIRFGINYIFVRVASDDLTASLGEVEREWKKINPDYRNDASYLGENTMRLYEQEKRLSHIILVGGIIAISIACMGLFAAALLATQKRTKEIGIRKVLGSSTSQLVVLLSKDFIRMVLIALIIGLPIAWFLAKEWINNFSYRYALSPAVLVICALAILLIAFLTVSVHTLRAAMDKPVNSLRDE